jgi:P-type Ca2+ transporter type 2C
LATVHRGGNRCGDQEDEFDSGDHDSPQFRGAAVHVHRGWAMTAVNTASRSAEGETWYALSPDDVAMRLDVNVAEGLSAEEVTSLLTERGPNSLPAEKSVPGCRRLSGQYRSYMQIILLGAAVVSLAIQEWSTGVLLLLIKVLNAVVSLRQEGKAESAMNALQAMVKATARVRRDGSETCQHHQR